MSDTTRLDFARETARQAGQLLQETNRARFPEHTILSEEGLGDLDARVGEAASLLRFGPELAVWLVDPLDGMLEVFESARRGAMERTGRSAGTLPRG